MTGLNIDERFRRTDSLGARDFLVDAVGSTLALADSVGTIQTSYTYESYGNTSESGQASGNSYQYTAAIGMRRGCISIEQDIMSGKAAVCV